MPTFINTKQGNTLSVPEHQATMYDESPHYERLNPGTNQPETPKFDNTKSGK